MISNLQFTWKILKVIGIQSHASETKKNIICRSCISIQLFLFLILTDFLYVFTLILLLKKQNYELTFIFSFLTPVFCYPIMCCVMWHKRRYLRRLKIITDKIHPQKSSKVFLLLNLLHILNIVFFLFHPLLYLFIEIKYYAEFEIYPIEYVEFPWLFMAGGGIYAIVFYQITFPLFITLVFVSFCYWCSSELKAVQKELESFSLFLHSRIFEILKAYDEVIEVATTVEDAFSNVTFLLLVSHFVNTFTSMGNILRGTFTSFLRIQCLINLIFDVLGLILLIFLAAETPIVLEKIKKSLGILEERVNFSNKNQQKSLKMAVKTFLKKDIFVFSACNMVFFRRTLIIASFGTLISYGLLLIQLNDIKLAS